MRFTRPEGGGERFGGPPAHNEFSPPGKDSGEDPPGARPRGPGRPGCRRLFILPPDHLSEPDFTPSFGMIFLNPRMIWLVS